MTKVAIITSYFPFGTPEQFFEAELPFWAASGHDVTLLPMRSKGPARAVPLEIAVDTSLAVLDSPRRRGTLVNLLRAAVDTSTMREILQTARSGRFTLRGMMEILSTEAQVRYLTKRLEDLTERNGGFDVVYAYWHGTAAYAAGAAAFRGAAIGTTVARAHRVDLYEVSRSSGHHPRKRHYQSLIDLHAPISQTGAAYLSSVYGVDPARIEVARLGCKVTQQRADTSPEDEFHILSASFVIPLKRVDAILRAVVDVARRHPHMHISWTHLGAGPEFAELVAEARSNRLPNLTISLPGQVPHNQVLEHLASLPVDVFVNFSTSEGVPVSIMEAMSFGVPAIAPPVGGVSELVDVRVGELLVPEAGETHLADALARAMATAKSPPTRQAAATRVENTYDAETNFRRFITTVTAPR